MNCSRNTDIQIWTGGQKQQILTMDGTSVNESKYTTQAEHDGFSLKIKGFSKKMPSDSPKSTTVLPLRVQSVTCVCSNEAHLSSSQLFHLVSATKISLNLTTNVTRDTLFYNMEFNTSYEVDDALCGHLQVICTVGTSTHSLIDTFIFDDQSQFIEKCRQVPVRTGTLQKTILVVIIGLPSIFLTIFICSIMISWKYRHYIENLYTFIFNHSARIESQNVKEEPIKESLLPLNLSDSTNSSPIGHVDSSN
ncbi:unnamed protein product [Mytilus edulis]|uniref:Uncharacterized protein n=1 Tax=Mytilus edulis TaxID=6550 RepID=A0A8S3V8E6_MYTED|nr:unnamed protein product [Mytilus edulis]